MKRQSLKTSLRRRGSENRAEHTRKRRQQYLEMINTGRIKNPVDKTLEYYDIVKVGDKYSVIP